MRTKQHNMIQFHHSLGDITIHPAINHIHVDVLKTLIQLALDSYLETDKVQAEVVHLETKERHKENYQTPGYFLKLYRNRASLTQQQLAKKLQVKQHHISEMENNKRSIGKALAKKISAVLRFDYHKLL